MRYHVRTPDGELVYPSMRDVELAYVQGLVGPDDEVLEEGQKLWRKAASIPVLARARAESKGYGAGAQTMNAALAVVMGLFALLLLVRSDSPTQRGLGLALALATAMLLSRVTYKAFKKPGTPKR